MIVAVGAIDGFVNQAGGGEQAGPGFDNGERGDDAAPDHRPHGGQRHGMPGHHDREAIQTPAGETEEDPFFGDVYISTGGSTTTSKTSSFA